MCNAMELPQLPISSVLAFGEKLERIPDPPHIGLPQFPVYQKAVVCWCDIRVISSCPSVPSKDPLV